MTAIPHFYPVIMAGGSGTRLWPWSRRARPKQFLRFNSPYTLLQETYRRVLPLTSPERVLVVTNRRFVNEVQEQLPELPPENVLGEPEGRNTAPAIGWAAVVLHRRDPNAVMAALPADHIIARVERFRRVLRAAVAVAQEGYIVTLGITPTHPATGYGYIEQGDVLTEREGFTVYRLLRFTEKPDRTTAEAFLKAGRYVWNSGMFIWRVDRVLREIQQQMPDLYAGLERLGAVWGTPAAPETLAEVWPTLPKESVDYGIMEHVTDAAVIPADIGWNDVGSWEAVYQEYPKDASGNAVSGEVLMIDAEDNLVLGERRLVVVVGATNLVVVETEDAILICTRERAQDVRQVVKTLTAQGREEYL